ncbi:MAG: acetoin dehydrogenase dihydrolipoyllysine-residue acetyltransferase subunit [Caulobacterales bacterium]|nr:acetoin dehydrogenase dihydrolipoyllysine-residue acetyltransferase subunit [Caulobacterales bacterium]
MTDIVPVKMPKWGLSMTEGTVVAWHVAQGARVAAGEDLVDIETTKITNVGEAPADGLLRRILAGPGQTLPVGALIAVMAEESVADAAIDAFVAEFAESFDPDEAGGAEAGLDIRTVDIGAGRALRVGVAGADQAGRAVVLLHGFGGDLENWTLVQESLASARPVYAVELPGHGRSSKAVGEGRLADLADAVEAAVDGLGLQDGWILGGHSLGGAVAVELALRRGDRLAGLALICPAAMPGGRLSGEYLDAFVSARRARDLRAPVASLFADPAMVTRDMLEELIKSKRLDGAQEALSAIKDNLKGGDPAYGALGDRLAGLAAPLVVIASHADAIVGAPDPERLPAGAQIRWIEGAGHMPHLETSAEVSGILSEFAGASGA